MSSHEPLCIYIPRKPEPMQMFLRPASTFVRACPRILVSRYLQLTLIPGLVLRFWVQRGILSRQSALFKEGVGTKFELSIRPTFLNTAWILLVVSGVFYAILPSQPPDSALASIRSLQHERPQAYKLCLYFRVAVCQKRPGYSLRHFVQRARLVMERWLPGRNIVAQPPSRHVAHILGHFPGDLLLRYCDTLLLRMCSGDAGSR